MDTWSRGPKTPAPSHSEQEAETGLLTTSITFPVAICPGWQVAFDQLGKEHQAAVAHFPDWHPDVDGTEAQSTA